MIIKDREIKVKRCCSKDTKLQLSPVGLFCSWLFIVRTLYHILKICNKVGFKCSNHKNLRKYILNELESISKHTV